MKFTVNDSAANLVRSYRPGRLELNSGVYSTSVLLSATRVEPWAVESASGVEAANFEVLLEYRPAVVLVGTGERQVMLSPRLYRSLLEAGIGVEIMATDAAVRTYNVLVTEDRQVLAALVV